MGERSSPLVVLAGPTAAGKTELSLKLAEQIGGSIVSADSMQVYKGLDIGSAKIFPEEQRGIPHYLIDVLEPEEPFHVARFQTMAREAVQDILDHGRVPVLTGGTGFYIQAVVRDIDFSESSGASEIRDKWEKTALDRGAEYVHEKLAEVDPESAAVIHANNIRRVIRALEFYEQTGTTISCHNRTQHMRRPIWTTVYFVITDERSRLYDRINERVDEMMRNGLEEEVRRLAARGLTEENSSMKGIGYKEFFPYFRGEYTLERAVELIKQNTRHYAKRQLTWFRREPDAVWINKKDFAYNEEEILKYMLQEYRLRTETEEPAAADVNTMQGTGKQI